MNLLIGQRVSVTLKNGKKTEGYIDRNKAGEKIVLTETCWIPFKECEKITAKGRLIEIGISNDFTQLFAPIDFKKVKNDKDKEDIINSSIEVIKQSNEDAKNQTDDELKTIAQNALDNVKTSDEIRKGETTETKEAQEKIKEFELEDQEERDNAIKNAAEIQEKVRLYKSEKDRLIAETIQKQTKKDDMTKEEFEEKRKEKFNSMLKEAGYFDIESNFEKIVESFQLASNRGFTLEDMYEHVVACIKPDEKLVESVKDVENGADRVVALCEACKKDVYNKVLVEASALLKSAGTKPITMVAGEVANELVQSGNIDGALKNHESEFWAAAKARMLNSAETDRSNELKENAELKEGAENDAADVYRKGFTLTLLRKLNALKQNVQQWASTLAKSSYVGKLLDGGTLSQVANTGRIPSGM